MVIVPMPASVISRAAEWLQAMHGAGLSEGNGRLVGHDVDLAGRVLAEAKHERTVLPTLGSTGSAAHHNRPWELTTTDAAAQRARAGRRRRRGNGHLTLSSTGALAELIPF
jgi:hypothetical protein